MAYAKARMASTWLKNELNDPQNKKFIIENIINSCCEEIVKNAIQKLHKNRRNRKIGYGANE